MRQSNDHLSAGGSVSGGKGRAPTSQFVLDAAQTCMPMLFTDATVRGNPIIFANAKYLALTGYTHSFIIGRPVRDLLKPPVSKQGGASILTALESGAEGSWDLRCLGANDREFFATVFSCPVYDEAERLSQNALTFVKIDGHLNRLVQEHNEFHAIFQQAPGFIAIVEGPRHRFTFANISYKNFVGRMHLEGLDVADAFPEFVTQGFVDLLDRVYQTGKPFIAKNAAVQVNNPATGKLQQKFADFVYQPVRAMDGTVTGIFCEGYDTTSQQVAADHLAALQAEMIQVSRTNAMGTMAVTLAHELNQPLAAIVNYAEGAERLIATAGTNNAIFAEALAEISGAAQRASELLKNLRQLTKRRTTETSHFNLKAACSECVQLICAVAHPSVAIIDRVPPKLQMIGDRIQVQQVLINVLRNACEAVEASDERTVVIDAIAQNREIIVSVTDTGAGFSPEAALSIFTFADSTKKEGMGIGLSICRTILENLGGRIWLGRSDAAGSEMLFSLPQYQAASTAPAK